MMRDISILVFFFILLMTGCLSPRNKQKLHFTTLPFSETGIDFSNIIAESDSVNLFIHEYVYMGGGVGIGDFNNDDLPDVFFTSNLHSSQLFLNKGNLEFENITQQAGVSTQAWCTGVSVVDINQDGWRDIYVCVSGTVPWNRRKNMLFINQRNNTFKEDAEAYNLADTSFSTQAVFFDYDKDGDLDMYLMNHRLLGETTNFVRPRIVNGTSLSADRLYRNEGIPAGRNHPVYLNVSEEAGILEDGYGLGIVVSDLNMDTYPDIYVANDYLQNDVMWLNNRDGTFSNCISTSLRHQGYSSMGTDAADYNNDGMPDIATLDMQPETNARKKMMFSFLNYQRYNMERENGYDPEFMRNMLQLNNGVRNINNRSEPFFSEIGQMAGMSETDWSWSLLMADFDNDGWKDMHITNGIGRDLINADFVMYRSNARRFADVNSLKQRRSLTDVLASYGTVPLRNYLYRNNGDLTFEDVSEKAGIIDKTISNGAAYADLDNDGDLDIVTNNINSPSRVLRNELYSPGNRSAENYVSVQLQGESMNQEGIGAIVYVYSGSNILTAEQFPVRGYLSSVDQRLHFGTGNQLADSIKIIWPDGKIQLILRPQMNRILKVSYKNANRYNQPSNPPSFLFSDITKAVGIDFKHTETYFNDYSFQTLLPQMYSQEGPFISTGDINSDGLEDLFVGGAYKYSGQLFFQQPNGTFSSTTLENGEKYEEDLQSLFFDSDNDNDLDLFIASGSTEFDLSSPYYRPRLYRNDGNGNFSRDSTAIPPGVLTAARSIAGADYDNDGDTDIFIGGRIVLGHYPQSPRSFLLRNDRGKFTDVTSSVSSHLQYPGMVTAAVWADIDNDKMPELIIAGEWMNVRVFKNNGKIFNEVTERCGMENMTGFWRSLLAADVDADGDMDVVAGNLGLNHPFHINNRQPARIYAKDFDSNGMIEPIFCYYIRDEMGRFKLYPGITRDQWATQMPSIRKKFNLNQTYANSDLAVILSEEETRDALVLECNETRSGYFENNGKGNFSFHPFPLMAQVSPVNAIIQYDVDKDGKNDLMLAGNEYEYNVAVGRMDASYGILLKQSGKGNFEPVVPHKSGLVIDGDVRDLKIISLGDTANALIISRNNEKIQFLKIN